MAPTVSPPLTDAVSRHQTLSDELDADIARIRAEIQSLSKRKQLLTSSLLSSTKIQAQLGEQEPSQGDIPSEFTPLQSQAQHNQTNIHRLAYGVTSFPFADPNPDTSDRPLLGIRFDIPSRSGKFDKAPYYIFLKRVSDEDTDSSSNLTNGPITNHNTTLKVHHHTIPALVPLQDYEAKYLSQPTTDPAQDNDGRDEGDLSSTIYDESDNNALQNGNVASGRTNIKTQNLHALVAAVRQDLVSWQLRTDAIALLAESLGLSDPASNTSNTETQAYSLQSLQATALDARFCRLVWRNGTVGRLRITDDGYVDRAIVIGDIGDEGNMARMKDVERVLYSRDNGRKLHLVDLPGRLEEVERRIGRTKTNANNDGNGNGNDNDDSMAVDEDNDVDV